MFANGLHMACGGFEALSSPPKPKAGYGAKGLLANVNPP